MWCSPEEVNQQIAKQMRNWIIGEVSKQLDKKSKDRPLRTPKKTICLQRLFADLLFYSFEVRLSTPCTARR